MSSLDCITCDTTRHETIIKYPSDVKLLFDSELWIYTQVRALSKKESLLQRRTKIKKWTARAISSTKMK